MSEVKNGPLGPYQEVSLPEFPNINMYEVESTSLSGLGFYAVPSQLDKPIDERTFILFARFKGGVYYRYSQVAATVIRSLGLEIKKKGKGDQSASVGKLFHSLIKTDSTLQVFKLHNNRWQIISEGL